MKYIALMMLVVFGLIEFILRVGFILAILCTVVGIVLLLSVWNDKWLSPVCWQLAEKLI